MNTLSYEQKTSIGLQFILDSLSPCCIYGKEEIKAQKTYDNSERERLDQELNQIQGLLEHYDKCSSFIDQINLFLMEVKEIRGALKRGEATALNDIELFEIKKFLLQMNKLVPVFEELVKVVDLPLLSFSDTSRALDILDPERKRIPGFYISESYSEELKQIRERKRHLEVVLRQEHGEEKKERLLEDRRNQVVLEDKEEQRIRLELTLRLRKHYELILANIDAAGKLDFLIQKVILAKKYQGVRPEITKDELQLTNMGNPEVSDFLKERNKIFTPLSFSMKKGAAVITGANMGGKSVALRTIALNIMLAQMGYFVFAECAKIPLYQYICITAEEFQSIQNGLSSFGGEIIQLQQAVDHLETGFGFLMFDELARGTNPDEGTAIVQAVVKYLNVQNAMTVVATHYDHVAEFANYHYQIYGLKNADLDVLERDIKSAEVSKGIEIIEKYMNYGIYQVEDEADCPRDAVHICGLLGLKKEIMELIQ